MYPYAIPPGTVSINTAGTALCRVGVLRTTVPARRKHPYLVLVPLETGRIPATIWRFYMRFDELDTALLIELQHYARQTDIELAAAVGTTAEVVADRVQTLNQRKIVKAYRAEIDLAAIGRQIQALIAVRIRTYVDDAIDSFRDWVTGTPEAVNVYVTSGSSDFLVHVAVPTADHLYSFVADQIIPQPTVLEARTSLVFEHLRGRILAPLDYVPAGQHQQNPRNEREHIA